MTTPKYIRPIGLANGAYTLSGQTHPEPKLENETLVEFMNRNIKLRQTAKIAKIAEKIKATTSKSFGLDCQ